MIQAIRNRDLLFGLTAVLVGVGAIMIIFIVTWQIVPQAVDPGVHPRWAQGL